MPQGIRLTSRHIRRALRQLSKGVYWAITQIKILVWQIIKGPSEGWVTFLLLLLSVMLAVWSVGSVQWVAATPGLYLLALWGVVLGLLLAKMTERLFVDDADDVESLKVYLLERFAGQKLSYEQAKEKSYQETPSIDKHYRQALQELRKEGKISVTLVSSKTERGLRGHDFIAFF